MPIISIQIVGRDHPQQQQQQQQQEQLKKLIAHWSTISGK